MCWTSRSQGYIRRTPRSNLATYTGLLDHVRRLFVATKQARARKYDAGRFSFNVAKDRCEACQRGGYVCAELLSYSTERLCAVPDLHGRATTSHGAER